MIPAGYGFGGRRAFLLPAILSACILAAAPAPAALGDTSRYLPLDHPLYAYLDRLQERGRLLKLYPALRPYTSAQVLGALKSQDSSLLKPFEREWLDYVRTQCELESEALPSDSDSDRMAVITRAEAAGEIRNLRPGRGRSQAGVGFGGRFGGLVFDSRFLRAPQLLRLQDTTAHRDPSVLPPLEEGLIRPMEGYLKGDFALPGGACSSEIFFGRLARNWSPGLEHSLILGSDALSFDQLAICLRSSHLVFTHLVATLDNMRYVTPPDTRIIRARRFLSAHRLDIRVRDWLRFGITETAVYGGENRGFEPALMNPFTSFRLTAIQNKNDWNNNSFISLDGYYNIRERAALYGQFLFDDFLRDKNIQDRWALDAGFNLRDLPFPDRCTMGLRATVVSSFAYNTFQPYERYLFNGRPLGAPLGDDYWKLQGFCRYFLSGGLDLTGHLSRVERGSRRIAAPSAPLLNSAGLAFPVPTVERSTEAGLALRWQVSPQAHLEIEGGWLKTANLNNRPGVNRNRGYVSLILSLYHDTVVRF